MQKDIALCKGPVYQQQISRHATLIQQEWARGRRARSLIPASSRGILVENV